MSATEVDRRPRRTLTTDVLVAGGGAAGVAAAVTAARMGARVLLVERYGFCGGGAVAGMSGTVCGLYLSSADAAAPPRMVVGGFAGEFLDALEGLGGLTGPVRYGRTFTRVHDPLRWRQAADRLLAEAGVTVLFHTTITGALLDGTRVAGVTATTAGGSLTIRAERTIDATGDAAVLAMAGDRLLEPPEVSVQNPTMMFRVSGVDTAALQAAYGDDSIMPPSVWEQIERARETGLDLPRTKIFLFPTPRPNELLVNATRISGLQGEELNVLLAEDISEAERGGRRQVDAYLTFLRQQIAGCGGAFIVDTGTQVGIRQTRQLVGSYQLTAADVLGRARFPDAVARCPWPIELHRGERPRLEWIDEGVYEIPYRCFIPRGSENILAAGRCLSADAEAMASARVTGQCFQYGEAIGLATVMSLSDQISPSAVDGERLHEMLAERGLFAPVGE